VVIVPPEPASFLSAPTGNSSATWWVLADGSVRVEATIADVGALPDARVALNGGGGAAVLTAPTDRYDHGVLGDPLEAAAFAVLSEDGTVETVVEMPDGAVIEGLAPMWVDLDGDGEDEILVTVSTPEVGAGLVLFSADGERVAAAEPIGTGFRWMHQIAVAPIGPTGAREIVAIRTPHLDGVAEFYGWEQGELVLRASAGGVTSHVLGSRNLDLALVADADGDRRLELLAPAPDLTQLVAITRTGDGAGVDWRADIGGTMSTNLAAARDRGSLWLAVGTTDGTVRIWPGG
jgi:hypothetical protein